MIRAKERSKTDVMVRCSNEMEKNMVLRMFISLRDGTEETKKLVSVRDMNNRELIIKKREEMMTNDETKEQEVKS